MRISIGLELDNEGRALAWALDYPGCFAYGAEGPDAVIALVQGLVSYEDWAARHGEPGWANLGDFDLRVVETWQVYTINDHFEEQEGGYAVNAWFRQDWKPLQTSEIERGLTLLQWSREDLLNAARNLEDQVMDLQRPGERWSIRGILKHVAGAEWWYLDRLNLAEGGREQLPKDAFERLDWVREHLNRALPELAGRELVLGKDGELWSPRKLLRRALWHEINHREHILKLLRQDE
jgi:uncharacterized damage-inducible protein DinB